MIIYKQNMAFSNVLCEELKPMPRIKRCDEEVKKIKLIFTRLVKKTPVFAVRNILHQ